MRKPDKLSFIPALALVVVGGCECAAPPIDPPETPVVDETNACLPLDEAPEFAISSKADLRWKRVTPLKNDLMQALELDEQRVCSELGLDGFCFSLIHLVPLGGNDPVKSAMYRPVPEPGVTTSLAFERVVLSACGRRADEDTVLAPVVWRNIDLDGVGLADDDGMRADVTELYRRLLARNPTAEELDLVVSLREDVNGEPVSGRDFAKMACFAVATSSEFLFQ